MDSENMSEIEVEVEQPVEAVAADSEAKLDEPQSSDDETELYIEEEGEQTEEPKKHGMTEKQVRAAQKEDRAKWKKAKALAEKEAAENEKLAKQIADQARELAELKASVSKVTKGPKPSILDYSSDEEFFTDLDKWNGVKTAEPSQAPSEQSGSVDLSEDQAWHLHKHEEEIKKSFSDYDDVKSKATEAFSSAGVSDTTLAMKQVAAVCHEHDIDTGKVNYALGRFPDIAKELVEASAKNQSAVRTVLRKLEGKVQARTRKKINSEPEPKIKSNGAVNVGSEAERQAYTKWATSNSIADYKALQKIRSANKAQG